MLLHLFINGLKLGGTYNLENETAGIQFSLHGKNTAIGSRVYMPDTDSNLDNYNYNFITQNSKNFRQLTCAKPAQAFYSLKIKNTVVDQKTSNKIGPFVFVTGKETSMLSLLREIEKVNKQDNIGGILFRNVEFTASFAHRQELVDALKESKAKGKKIVFYFDNISNGNYAFAAALADKIYLNYQGTVDLRGMALNSPYFKELADTLGVDFISYQSHKYKSAFNMFTEKQMTPEERVALTSFLSDLYAEFVKMIDNGRGSKLAKPVQQMIDEGPYFDPEESVKLGLVDELIYESELSAKLKKDFGFNGKADRFDDLIAYDWSQPAVTKVAVIYAQGNILMGKSKDGKTIGSKSLSETIAKVRKDPQIKGIILRVNSGGGSGQASDIIANEIKLCNSGKNKKPVVASMSGAAASGGYYISAFANKIIAEPGTITGSIGVTGLGFHAERLFHKIHVNWSSIKFGEHADLGSLTRPPTADETAMMRQMTEKFYEKFVHVVATGRNMTDDAVHAVAQGRVWTGNQALERGLIDGLGGMNTAISEIRKLAHIQGKIDLVEYPKTAGGFEVVLDMNSPIGLAQSASLPAELGRLQELAEQWQQLQNEKCLMLTPLDTKQWDR
jgi:protease-4